MKIRIGDGSIVDVEVGDFVLVSSAPSDKSEYFPDLNIPIEIASVYEMEGIDDGMTYVKLPNEHVNRAGYVVISCAPYRIIKKVDSKKYRLLFRRTLKEL